MSNHIPNALARGRSRREDDGSSGSCASASSSSFHQRRARREDCFLFGFSSVPEEIVHFNVSRSSCRLPMVISFSCSAKNCVIFSSAD